MGYCGLYQNTELEQIWHNRKKVMDTFPKECKKNVDPQYLGTSQKPPHFLGGLDRDTKPTRCDEV
jgi:hypothetical protein